MKIKLSLIKNFLLSLAILFGAVSAKANDVVVLVPGFFNAFAPEYFSREIIHSFTQKGFKVYVATGLNPIGTIAQNGATVEHILGQIEAREGRKVAFNIVAHSAGGFYSFWVAHRQKFVIKNIYTISTPYKGVEFVEAWLRNSALFSAVTELAHFEGLKELTAPGVKRFLGWVRVSPQTKVIAFGGHQPEYIDITDARNISAPLRITSHFISGPSDGIVGFSSSLGLGMLKSHDSKRAQQFVVSNVTLNLEHWEQVLDSHAFLFLGIRNTGFIAKEQRRFYSGLADHLLKNK